MADPHGITDVAVTGWGSLAGKTTAAGVWTAVLVLIGYFIRSRVPMRKLKMEADESLRQDLLEQLHRVEQAATDKCEKLERHLEKERLERAHERAEAEARMSIMRHELGNVRANFDALLLLIEAAPDKAAEHVAKIRAAMAQREAGISAEKAALHSAKITAASGPIVEP